MTFKEKRRFRRVYDEVAVRIGESLWHTENIGNGGVFLRCSDMAIMLEDSNTIELELLLPPREERVKVKGRVVYTIDPELAKKIKRPAGIGIEFLEFSDEESMKKLRFYLERIEQVWEFSGGDEDKNA